MTTSPVLVRDLPITPGPVSLSCLNPDCPAHMVLWSANQRDYFYLPDTEPMLCDCGEGLVLVTTHTVMVLA